MAGILIKNGRIWDGNRFLHSDILTDKAGNRLCDTKGYRCVLTVSDGQIVYKH